MTCEWGLCTNALPSTRSKYCSSECRALATAAKRKVFKIKKCIICNNEFRTSNNRHIICKDPECITEKKRRDDKRTNYLQNLRRLQNKPVKHCLACKAELPSHRSKYCESKECQREKDRKARSRWVAKDPEHAKKVLRRSRRTRHCVVCKTKITNGNLIYCSDTCRRDVKNARLRIWRAERHTRSGGPRHCLVCNKEITNKNLKYCGDEECYSLEKKARDRAYRTKQPKRIRKPMVVSEEKKAKIREKNRIKAEEFQKAKERREAKEPTIRALSEKENDLIAQFLRKNKG